MDTKTVSRADVIAHLEFPVCKIRSGVWIHLQAIGLRRTWELCYALQCSSPEKLLAVMWKMIKKRKRKDSSWQKFLPRPKDGS